MALGFPRLQEIADSRDLFGEVVGKLLPGARDEGERALVTQESERKSKWNGIKYTRPHSDKNSFVKTKYKLSK